jgi:outer membrane protein insertion porin family/translocation and assembly module TamA
MQLLGFRALFSGGPYSNRGYLTNSIGPRAVVLDTSDELETIVSGGRTLWESSLELRFPIFGDLGGGVFLDASDVTRGELELRLTHPHVSTGLGLRYDTPVGPLRADVGYRIPCLQILGTAADGGCLELPTSSGTITDATPVIAEEGSPGSVLGAPIAISIVFGQAF